MTKESQIKGLSLNLQDDMTLLRVNAALEWLKDNTILEFDPEDEESVNSLPGSAKLFVYKFNELYDREIGVTSESIAGMSQSFETGSSEALLWRLAKDLLGSLLKNKGIKFTPAVRKW